MTTTTTKPRNTLRVGILVSVAALVLMIFVFFIGSEQKIFAKKNEYDVRLETVTGLAAGNPVKMSGVTIGVIKNIELPRDPRQRSVHIQLMIDEKYSDRVRGDSRARMKKLGLLGGDSYIDITPGSPRTEALEAGSIIPAQRQTNVDQLISSGEDLVDNFVQISYSLKNVLGRVDRGEGLLGEITSTPETKQRLTDTLLTTLNKTNAALGHIESGRGVVGRLVYDDKYGEQLTTSLTSAAQSLQAVTASVQHSFESGSGTLPALLSDAEGKKKVIELTENLRLTSENLAKFSGSLQTGEGLVPRLLNDKAYGDQAMQQFVHLVAQLNDVVRKINTGEGTAGKLIADPSVYESINDILIGINESRMLRWLVRTQQQRGIEKRFETEQEKPAPPVDVKTTITPPAPTEPPTIPPTMTTPETTSTQPPATAT